MEEANFSQLRSLDDFLLSARFQLPNFRDWEKWENRVTNNLVYYRSNYLLMVSIVFILFSLLHPKEALQAFGILVIIGLGVYYYILGTGSVARFKVKYPTVNRILMPMICVAVLYMLKFIVVYLFAVFLSVLLTVLHASLRLRNIRNKITNKLCAN